VLWNHRDRLNPGLMGNPKRIRIRVLTTRKYKKNYQLNNSNFLLIKTAINFCLNLNKELLSSDGSREKYQL
jgi:hypothetical protein